MKAQAIGRKTILFTSRFVNLTVLTIILLLLAFAGYALWDSEQIYQAADKTNYAVYKPTVVDEGKSFKELQAINAEVFAWLSVYGTNIDYPVTQGRDNMKYINTNAEGLYSLSGSIFLDSGNSSDFSDFNSILYGHHMEKKTMFGEIGSFADKNMFDSHRYGNLYFDGDDHGIEFFAFVHTDAYDNAVFTPNAAQDKRQSYLNGLLGKAMYTRDIGVTTEDHIVLLSTCSSGSTNGRDILVGRISDEVFGDPFTNTTANDGKKQPGTAGQDGFLKDVTLWVLILAIILILAVRLSLRVLATCRRRKYSKTTEARW